MKAEFQKELSKAQKTVDTTSQQLANVQRELAVTKAQAQLAALDLPTEFASNFLGKDDAETTQNIQGFSAKVNELVAAKVNESLARGPPMTGGSVATQQEQLLAQLRAAANLPTKE